jgi:hypothetical protein
VSTRQWRLRVARWLAPDGALREPLAIAQAPQAEAAVPDAWADVCEQFAWRLLVLTEQLRPVLDGLEGSEEDPDRLGRLYQVDHGVTRTRKVARDLRVLVGRGGEEIAEHTTSLLDVIRMAASAIEHYSRVTVGSVADLAVLAYAADDVASLLAALTDNATRYSPGQVTVSAHLLADGGVMLRVEDAGLGIEPGWLAALNTVLDGPLPAAGVINGRHTGFTIVHRLARRHGLRVQLASRQLPGPGAAAMAASGTIAMVVLPAPLLCEIPDEPFPNGQVGHPPLASIVPAQGRGAHPPGRATPARVAPPSQDWPPVQDWPAPQGHPPPGHSQQGHPDDGRTPMTLPRREPGSVRTPPPRRAQAAAPQPPPPDPVAEGFAFADDLQAFSTALRTGQPAGTEPDEHRPDDAGGRRP